MSGVNFRIRCSKCGQGFGAADRILMLPCDPPKYAHAGDCPTPQAPLPKGWSSGHPGPGGPAPAEAAVLLMLRAIGEDPDREGLLETPRRVAEAWKEMFAGYTAPPSEAILKTFDRPPGYDEMVVVNDIPFVSVCVVGSTFVETPRGRVPIQYLKDGSTVYAFDTRTNEIRLARCRNPRMTRRSAELVRVYTDLDTVLCTPDHRFLTWNRGWVRADALRAGDSVVALNRSVGIDNQGHPRVVISTVKSGRPPGKKGAGTTHEAHLVYDQLPRPSRQGGDVHHKNGKTWDNRPGNLELLSSSEHSARHAGEDGRGRREAERWARMSAKQRRKWEKRRKAGLAAVHQDPERRAAMLEKRRQSVQDHWARVKADPELYAQRTKNMRGPNHKVIAVEKVKWREDVWCMDVPGYENFFANGMCVHNCEHHLLPFQGVAHVGYVPDRRIAGLSKFPRLVEKYARRAQVQERITAEVMEDVARVLEPRGVGVVLTATHGCISCRGVNKAGISATTSALWGCVKTDPACRAEFLKLAGRK